MHDRHPRGEWGPDGRAGKIAVPALSVFVDVRAAVVVVIVMVVPLSNGRVDSGRRSYDAWTTDGMMCRQVFCDGALPCFGEVEK